MLLPSIPPTRHPVSRRKVLLAALCASLVTMLVYAYAASATNQNYNCQTVGDNYPCPSALSTTDYLTNDFAIDYSGETGILRGVCASTVQAPNNPWKTSCTNSYEIWACNGGEYQIYGFGETDDHGGLGTDSENLAGTINNYSHCG